MKLSLGQDWGYEAVTRSGLGIWSCYSVRTGDIKLSLGQGVGYEVVTRSGLEI